MVAASPLRAAAVPSVVFLVVASSPPLTTSSTSSTPATSTASSTSSTTMSVRALRAHGLHRAVRVLRRLLRAPPSRPPVHQALRQIIRGYLVASSSTTLSPSSPSTSTPSSTPATAGCIGIFFLAVLLRLQPSWRPSLLVPRRRRLVVHPPLHVRYWQHRCVAIVPDAFPSLANSGMCRPMA